MSDNGDDELERRLRDVLNSRGLGVPVSPDAIDRIHDGARRRQQRRATAAAFAGVVVIAVVAGAIGVRTHRQGAVVTADKSPSSTVVSAVPSSISSPDVSSPTAVPPVASTSASAAPASSAGPSSPLPEPATSQSAAALAPGGFLPVSVSAVGLNDYWVLGYTSTKTSDGWDISTTIKQTTDAGQHFTNDAAPAVTVAQAPTSYPTGTPTISDVRFGDASNGWAFGNTLYATTDGGASWSAVTDLPGGVVDLAASNGVAWAVVQIASTSTANSPAVSDQYELWSTTYGRGSQAWSQVALPVRLGSIQPSIVDQDGTVTVMASGPDRAGTRVHVLTATPGHSFTDNSGPCEQDLGGVLSNSKAAIWAECPHGNGASVWVSSNRGASWTSIPATGADVETGAALGAIDAATAVVFDAANQRLARISGRSAASTDLVATDTITFVGFTTPAVGFAVAIGDDGFSFLDRTTDGGRTWSTVSF
jgi:hypothetical protein